MESTLRNELESLIKQYDAIKDCFGGAEQSFPDIREQLESFKDRFSKVRLQLMLHVTRQGNPVNMSFQLIMNAMDLASIMMESDPKNARQFLQSALFISSVKIEDLMSFLSLIRESM